MCVQVPVFGDQQFWGDLCSKLGVGPKPVPITRLRRQDLLTAFAVLDQPEMKDKAAAMGEAISRESGVDNAVRHFHAYATSSHNSESCSPSHSKAAPFSALSRTVPKNRIRNSETWGSLKSTLVLLGLFAVGHVSLLGTYTTALRRVLCE